MTKNEALKKLESLKGIPMKYGNKLWKLKNYSYDDVQDRFHMHTEQGKSYDRPSDGIGDFLEQLDIIKDADIKSEPQFSFKELIKKEDTLKYTNEEAPKTFSDLKGILLDNIELLRKGKIDVDVAKEICNQTQTIVNITKVELDYFKIKK